MQGNRRPDQLAKDSPLPGARPCAPGQPVDQRTRHDHHTDEELPQLLTPGHRLIRLLGDGPHGGHVELRHKLLAHIRRLLLSLIPIVRTALRLGVRSMIRTAKRRQHALEVLLCKYESGLPIDQVQLAALAGLVARAPGYAFALDSVETLVAAGAVRGPTVEDVQQVAHASMAQDQQRHAAVLLLDGLCAAEHFCHSGLLVRQVLRQQIVALRREALVYPAVWGTLAPLARDVLRWAPPCEGDLARALWQTLASLDGGKQKGGVATAPVLSSVIVLFLGLIGACTTFSGGVPSGGLR